jgi:hypothetical protein
MIIVGSPAFKKDLYYVVSAAYNAKGDTVNELKYEEMGNMSVKLNN